MFVLVYSNEDVDSKRFKAERYYLPKGIIKNYSVINNRKNFYDQTIDSDIKRYEEIGKLTTGQGKDYTTGCLLDWLYVDYIKNSYRLVAVDLSRIRFWSKSNRTNINHWTIKKSRRCTCCEWIHICLDNFRKIQRNAIKVFSWKCNSIIKDGRKARRESSVNKTIIKQITTCSMK